MSGAGLTPSPTGRSTAQRMAENVGRIAGVLHLFAHGGTDAPIGGDTMVAACEVGGFYLKEALRIAGGVVVDAETQAANDLATWIEGRTGDLIAPSHIQRLAPNALRMNAAKTRERIRSPTAHLSGPPAWRDGLARLDRWTPPCEGFRSGEWEAVHRAVSHFMDHYAAEATQRGWTALDLFGVHGLAGAARVDSCGALMLPLLRNATALTADAIAFGHLTYRRRPMPEAVLVWDLVGETA